MVVMVGRQGRRCVLVDDWMDTAAATQDFRGCHLGRGLEKAAGPVCGGVGRLENACLGKFAGGLGKGISCNRGVEALRFGDDHVSRTRNLCGFASSTGLVFVKRRDQRQEVDYAVHPFHCRVPCVQLLPRFWLGK